MNHLLPLVLIGLIVFALPRVTSLSARFTLTMVLSVPQLYALPVADFYLSLAFVSSYALWPEALRTWRSLLRNPAMLTGVAIVLVQVLSLLWSPDLRLGIRTLAYTLPFFLIASAATIIARENPQLLRTVLGIVCAELLVLAAVVVAFRLDPALEMAYLQSELAGWLTGPNTIHAMLDGTGRNNVFDPVKSGGVFVNANVAAAYLGVGAFIAYMLAGQKHPWRNLLAGTLLLTGAFFTGSKAGILLGVSLPLAAAVVAWRAGFDRTTRNTLLALALLVAPACLLLVWQISPTSTDFLYESANTTGTRLQIWAYAAQTFPDAPLLGQGFGGWQKGFSAYAQANGLSPAFPPHNTLIYLWSQSGLPAALLAVVFMALIGRLAWRMVHSPLPANQHLGLLLGLACAWHFGHAMGENWGLWGEVHLLPLIATLVGWAIGTQATGTTGGQSGHPTLVPSQPT
jgi:hypothetical protein